MAKRFRFNLGWRKTAPLVARIGRGRIWQFCKKSNEKELKSRGARRGEKGSFNGFRKKETAGRSSGREKGENKI